MKQKNSLRCNYGTDKYGYYFIGIGKFEYWVYQRVFIGLVKSLDYSICYFNPWYFIFQPNSASLRRATFR